jgi:hypothetical protein
MRSRLSAGVPTFQYGRTHERATENVMTPVRARHEQKAALERPEHFT